MKRFAGYLLPMAAMMIFSGCLKYEPGTERITEPIVTDIPEGGWTEETLTAVCSVDGVPLTQPVTLRDFGMDYRYELPWDTKSITNPDYPEAQPYCYLEGQNTYFVSFPRGTQTDTLNADTPIIAISAYAYPDGEERPFYVNGITYGCTEQEAVAALGEPQYRHEGKKDDENVFAVTCQYDSSATGEPILDIYFKSNDEGELVLFYISLDVSGENQWKEARK